METMLGRRVSLGDPIGKIIEGSLCLQMVGIDGAFTVDGWVFCILVSEILFLYIVAIGDVMPREHLRSCRNTACCI
jgi:hypothetical protein